MSMKDVLVARLSGVRLRSRSRSSSNACSPTASSRANLRVTLTTFPGKMQLTTGLSSQDNGGHDDGNDDDEEDMVNVLFRIDVDALSATARDGNEDGGSDGAPLFHAAYTDISKIVWDHTAQSMGVTMTTDDGHCPFSAFFVFPTLAVVELQVASALSQPVLHQRPEQVYVGVLVGNNQPSPIQQQQRRVSSVAASSSTTSPLPPLPPLSAAARHQLLARERPPRQLTPRAQLALEFFRLGTLSFACWINGEVRGLRLDLRGIHVFPTPDCMADRGACLLTYQYEQLESCELRVPRLELRFRRCAGGAKLPWLVAFQSADALAIRDALWDLKTGGEPLEMHYRRIAAAASSLEAVVAPATATASASATVAAGSSDGGGGGTAAAAGAVMRPTPSSSSSAISLGRRRSSLTYFRDEGAIHDHVLARCGAVGCSRHRTDDPPSAEADDRDHGRQSSSSSRRRMSPASASASGSTSSIITGGMWFCHEHAVASPTRASWPISPLHFPSTTTRASLSLFSKDATSTATATASLVHSPQYARCMKYHGTLLKSSSPLQLRRAWTAKHALLLDTPVGSCLCYYDRLSQCPGMTDTPKERRVIELSAVLGIRRVSTVPQAPAFAFDIVTVYRQWTFAAASAAEYDTWLHMLAEAVARMSTIPPDAPLHFPVRAVVDPFHHLPSRQDPIELEISSHGVAVCAGSEGSAEVYSWYFTEVHTWAVVQDQNGETCCLLNCRAPLSGPNVGGSGTNTAPKAAVTSSYHEFLFQTGDAADVCLAIEFFVGKCMAKLETLRVVASAEAATAAAAAAVASVTRAYRSSSVQPATLAKTATADSVRQPQEPAPRPTSASAFASALASERRATTVDQTLKMTQPGDLSPKQLSDASFSLRPGGESAQALALNVKGNSRSRGGEPTSTPGTAPSLEASCMGDSQVRTSSYPLSLPEPPDPRASEHQASQYSQKSEAVRATHTLADGTTSRYAAQDLTQPVAMERPIAHRSAAREECSEDVVALADIQLEIMVAETVGPVAVQGVTAQESSGAVVIENACEGQLVEKTLDYASLVCGNPTSGDDYERLEVIQSISSRDENSKIVSSESALVCSDYGPVWHALSDDALVNCEVSKVLVDVVKMVVLSGVRDERESDGIQVGDVEVSASDASANLSTQSQVGSLGWQDDARSDISDEDYDRFQSFQQSESIVFERCTEEVDEVCEASQLGSTSDGMDLVRFDGDDGKGEAVKPDDTNADSELIRCQNQFDEEVVMTQTQMISKLAPARKESGRKTDEEDRTDGGDSCSGDSWSISRDDQYDWEPDEQNTTVLENFGCDEDSVVLLEDEYLDAIDSISPISAEIDLDDVLGECVEIDM